MIFNVSSRLHAWAPIIYSILGSLLRIPPCHGKSLYFLCFSTFLLLYVMLFCMERGKFKLCFLVNHFLRGSGIHFQMVPQNSGFRQTPLGSVCAKGIPWKWSGKSDGKLRCSCLHLFNLLSPWKRVERALIFFASEYMDFRPRQWEKYCCRRGSLSRQLHKCIHGKLVMWIFPFPWKIKRTEN